MSKLVLFLSRFTEENGYPPTVREIQEELRCSSVSVAWYCIDKAVRQRLVKKTPLRASGLVLTEAGRLRVAELRKEIA